MDCEGSYWVPWLKLIEDAKKKHEFMPVNAQRDPSWQMVPGYDGVKMNAVKSLQNLDKLGRWDESQLVFEEINPCITISDLSPAPIYYGNPNKKMVSIMVNVAWGNEYLVGLLRVLKENKVKSTFFLDGSWIDKYPTLGEMIRDEGHEIGNHAYSHPDMRGMTMEGIKWQLEKTNETIKKELGVKPVVFTPPSGEFDERVVYFAALEGMITVLSTIDTLDWQKPRPEDIVEKIAANIGNGAMMLVHPSESSLLALPGIIKIAKERQFAISTVSDLLSTKRA